MDGSHPLQPVFGTLEQQSSLSCRRLSSCCASLESHCGFLESMSRSSPFGLALGPVGRSTGKASKASRRPILKSTSRSSRFNAAQQQPPQDTGKLLSFPTLTFGTNEISLAFRNSRFRRCGRCSNLLQRLFRFSRHLISPPYPSILSPPHHVDFPLSAQSPLVLRVATPIRCDEKRSLHPATLGWRL
ncbi:hypothetical protein P154DRAFT_577718 [Amniculicola lignicola CBS 123094]|uniref:Uncharacterized protein n=1 Tax=Amniculicola lignicola CBS 123094 TaxID=1392246 RepID=A0A6A5WCG8_9PLEO|nr:hypothetical protein P154DRAFT_577718 [Amniculicola lignicola CBS 123094]